MHSPAGCSGAVTFQVNGSLDLYDSPGNLKLVPNRESFTATGRLSGNRGTERSEGSTGTPWLGPGVAPDAEVTPGSMSVAKREPGGTGSMGLHGATPARVARGGAPAAEQSEVQVQAAACALAPEVLLGG